MLVVTYDWLLLLFTYYPKALYCRTPDTLGSNYEKDEKDKKAGFLVIGATLSLRPSVVSLPPASYVLCVVLIPGLCPYLDNNRVHIFK